MMRPDHPLFDTAVELAKNSKPIDIHMMKNIGLNRAFRRKLSSLAKRGQLTAHDFPVWLVARTITQGHAYG